MKHPSKQNTPSVNRTSIPRPAHSVPLHALALFALAATAAQATPQPIPITIPNASFESPTTPVQSNLNPYLIPGWTFSTSYGTEFGTQAISQAYPSPGAASGNDFAFIEGNGASTAQTITSAASLGTITASTQYTLAVAIATSGYTYSPTSFSLLGNGTALATDDVSTSTNDTFEDFSLTYDSPSSGSVIGENLTVQLAAIPYLPFEYFVGFDNVTLDATAEASNPAAVPEPSTWVMLVSGVLTLGWLIRRKLTPA